MQLSRKTPPSRFAARPQLRGSLPRCDDRKAAKGLGEASSLANTVILRGRLVGQEIVGGCIFEKYVLNEGRFKGLGIRTA